MAPPPAAAGSTRAATKTESIKPRGANRTGNKITSRPNGAGRGPAIGECSITAPLPIRLASPGPRPSAWSGGMKKSKPGPATIRPTSSPQLPPSHRAPEGARGKDAISGDDPFLLKVDGKGWLFAPTGLKDGPLPTHYEPVESIIQNPLYSQQANPKRIEWRPLRQSLSRALRRSALSVCRDNLSPDRASHCRRYEPLAVLALRVAA